MRKFIMPNRWANMPDEEFILLPTSKVAQLYNYILKWDRSYINDNSSRKHVKSEIEKIRSKIEIWFKSAPKELQDAFLEKVEQLENQ